MSEAKLSAVLGHRHITLHVWPRHGDLPSFDVASVATLLYLQLTIPGHFSLSYCANPDLSPAGQLPFLTHGLHHVSGFGPIVSCVRRSPNARQLDANLHGAEAAQMTARVAHVESNYGDLVNHMLYSLQENWCSVTRPALATMLPIPQRYYVPSRIRTSYKARLEAAELWHVPEDEDEPEEPRNVLGRRRKQRPENEPHKFKTALEREKVIEKARALFDVYDRLLGGQVFFMGSEAPTTLDVLFAAHTHVLLSLEFPDPLVVSVLKDSYPSFIAHRDAVLSLALPDPSTFPPTVRLGWTSFLRALVPWPRIPTSRRPPRAVNSKEVQDLEWRYRLWRWGFIGASVLAAAAYLNYATIVIVLQSRNGSRRLPGSREVRDVRTPGTEEDGKEEDGDVADG
ncbi:Tom37 C-terminal domain-containing protein [Daedaleopsis nitida]|nr:Tom37 C-terminal domain-containing protein [Daedaleopsis nitida]